MSDERFVSYYDKDFTTEQLEKALKLYFQWCKKNKQTPEVSEGDAIDNISDGEWGHIIYHAEIEGFNVNDEG